MFTVRSLPDIVLKNFIQWGGVPKYISFDESIVKYFYHNSAK